MFNKGLSFVYQYQNQLQKIIKDFEEQSKYVKFLNYLRHFDDGSFLSITSQPEWLEFWVKKHCNQNTVLPRMITGIHRWSENNNENILAMIKTAKENFGIENRIEFVYRDENNKCFHTYSFFSNKKYSEKTNAFYITRKAQLLKFIIYFDKYAKPLIVKAEEEENRFLIPNYSLFSKKQEQEDYVLNLRALNAKTEISDREFEVMMFYANGYTVKQISQIMCRGEKTIETHLHNIRNKMHYSDRASMNAFFRDNGWNGLINFFPYISEGEKGIVLSD